MCYLGVYRVPADPSDLNAVYYGLLDSKVNSKSFSAKTITLLRKKTAC